MWRRHSLHHHEGLNQAAVIWSKLYKSYAAINCRRDIFEFRGEYRSKKKQWNDQSKLVSRHFSNRNVVYKMYFFVLAVLIFFATASLVSHCHIHMLWFEWHRKLYTKQGLDDMLQISNKWQWSMKLWETKTAISSKTHFSPRLIVLYFMSIFSWSAQVGHTNLQNDYENKMIYSKSWKKWQWTTTNMRGDKNPLPFPLKLTPQLCFFLGIFSCWTALREACPKFSIFSSNCSCVCCWFRFGELDRALYLWLSVHYYKSSERSRPLFLR